MRNFIICTLKKYYYSDQMRCDGAVACMERDELCIQYFNWKTLLEELSATFIEDIPLCLCYKINYN
jgi:hypothetical protein